MALTYFDPSSLVTDDWPLPHEPITLAQGGPTLRGTLLGLAAEGAAAATVKASGANTGNGTFVLDPTNPILANAESGLYTLRATVVGTNSATFRLMSPKGAVLGDYAFTGAGATVAIADRIKGVITDGSTDFVVGDGFDVNVAATDVYKPCVRTAVDGSGDPAMVLATDTDTTAGPVATVAYSAGGFAFEKMTIDASWNITTLRAALRARNSAIHVRDIGQLG